MHPAAPHHLPFFLPGPDGSDPVMVGAGVFLLAAVVAFGLLFLRLHTLPERMAHRGHKLQFEIVAVLACRSNARVSSPIGIRSVTAVLSPQ